MSYLSRIADLSNSHSLNREELAYYARHILLPSVGLDGQRKLKSARVLVVGAGGLGCPVLQALSGAGVGHLTVTDGDRVSVSNLSRQWLHRYATLGQNKALSAQAALREVNPFIEVSAQASNLDQKNAHALVEAHDIVVDATDDLDARYLIDDICASLNRPWVHAALYRDRAQMTVFWNHCGANFRKLYPVPGQAPSCSGAGILGASASVIGNLQALEVIKLITGSGVPKLGELVSIDCAGLSLQSFQLPDVSPPKVIEALAAQHVSELAVTLVELSQSLSIHEPLTLIDLRGMSKFEKATLPGAVPLSEEAILENGLPEGCDGKTILICEEGLKSSLLADAFSREGAPIYFLEGGLQGALN